MSDYLSHLNQAQKEAVEAIHGPSIVIAGAGSGKTRVLTYRIAHLMQCGVDPFNILSLTFTNKAAREMKDRIESIMGGEARNLWMGTFHSVFARILRSESALIGYPYNFTIYDTIDAKSLIKSIIKELGLDDKIYKPSLVLNRISAAKNNLISADAYNRDDKILVEDKIMAKPRLGEIYARYQKACFRAGAMDFDDLLFKTNQLLEQHPDTLAKYQNIFQYVMVDEYQDTNFAQYLIIKKLSSAHHNVCVVGDDAQSIYSFRGADISNILNFQKDFPGAKIFKLEQNYRSTKTIVNAANCIIENNQKQIKKEVWTGNDAGNKIKLIKAKTDNEEGRFIAQEIQNLLLGGEAKNADCAILYRTNAQSRSMEEALRKQNIPYKIYGGLSFYQRKEIKDLLSYFRLTINPQDNEAFKRIINYPARGIGKSTLDKIILLSQQTSGSLWEVVNSDLASNLGAARKKIEGFVEMINSFQADLESVNAFDLGSRIASHSGITKELYDDKSPEGVSRYENIQEILNGLKQFSLVEETNPGETPTHNLSKFMQEVALMTTQDDEKEEDFDKVTLMTIHSAKGLEFPYVFVVGLEENLFPSQLSINSRTELEEERRLFYVAVTRAEKALTISYAQTRFKFGNITYSDPSRFIKELPDELLEDLSGSVQRSSYSHSNSSSPFIKSQGFKSGTNSTARPLTKISTAVNQTPAPSGTASNGEIKEGNNVEHLRFGRGKVLLIEGLGPSKKATIDFEKHGKKQILLKFAKLKIVN